MLRGENWRHFDFWLLGAVILANVFGVAMIRSAIAGNEILATVVPRQIIFAGIGLVAIVLFAAIDYRFWAGLIRPIYIVTLIFLSTLFVLGQASFGATRWLQAGLISIQPTELAKIVAILSMAYYFERTMNAPRDLYWIGRSLLVAAGIAFFIFVQPNLSNTLVVLVLWFLMIWVNGLKLEHLVAFAGIGLVLGLVALFAPFSPLEEYQRQRVFTFLFPDPNASYGATYNVQQALIAIGSGGWLGEGYGQATQVQLRFLKVRHTDFIFSATAAEFGFVGTVLVMLLIAFIVYRCLRAARLARDTYGAMIAYGVGMLIFFQAAVNIAVNLRLIPVTGLPLPFISYGGSGLVSLMAAIGLVESVVVRHKPLEF
ncbi:MAG: FtsW/RodA/SpoVE family cell cycle protein [Anaerolineales bacterium]